MQPVRDPQPAALRTSRRAGEEPSLYAVLLGGLFVRAASRTLLGAMVLLALFGLNHALPALVPRQAGWRLWGAAPVSLLGVGAVLLARRDRLPGHPLCRAWPLPPGTRSVSLIIVRLFDLAATYLLDVVHQLGGIVEPVYGDIAHRAHPRSFLERHLQRRVY